MRRIAYLLSEHILPMVCKRDFGLKQEFEGKLSRVATNLERTFLRQMPQLFAFMTHFVPIVHHSLQ